MIIFSEILHIQLIVLVTELVIKSAIICICKEHIRPLIYLLISKWKDDLPLYQESQSYICSITSSYRGLHKFPGFPLASMNYVTKNQQQLQKMIT